MDEEQTQTGSLGASTNWTPALNATINADFRRVQRLWQRLDDSLKSQAKQTSISASEHSDRLSALAHDLAATSLRATIDHLVTWQQVLTAGFMPTYAHFSIIRTAHESAWLAYWLVEPGAEADVRMARGVAAQRDDLDERRKVEEAMGNPVYDPPAKSAAHRLIDLLDEAERRGLTKLDRKGKRILSLPLPSAVELFDKYEPARDGKGSYLYRLYSGYAHGKQWAITQGAVVGGHATPSGTSLARVSSDPTRAVAATQRAVNAMDAAVCAFVALRD